MIFATRPSRVCLTVLMVGACFLPTRAMHGEVKQRPNIVFILADDLGIGDTNCYGGDKCQIETPNIDALAAGGLMFTDAHVNASVCVPTRVAIMSGRYPWRYGRAGPGGPWGFLGLKLHVDTFTLGKMFQQADYATGYIGKWHLGTVMTTNDGKPQNERNVDYAQPLKVGPPQYGFDYSFILPGSLDMYPYAFARNNVWQGEVTAQKGWSAFNRVGPAEKDFSDHQVLETFYKQTEDFLQSQDSDKPFFLFLALTAPHTPTSPGKSFQGKSQLGVYGDFVMEVDHAVQRVRTALEARGLDDTLILFSSDHGAAPYAGNILKATPGQLRELEKQGHYSSGPHRGYKFSVYEGGLRVPLIAHWPGRVPAGSRCDALVGLNDLLATFAEIVDHKLGQNEAPDSISFAKLLTDPKRQGARQDLVMQGLGPFVVRQGKWKLCLCPGSGSPLDHGNRPKSDVIWRELLSGRQQPLTWDAIKAAPFVQLFDMDNDPHEDHNLAAENPDKVKQLIAILRKQIDEGRSTPGPRLKNDVPRVNVTPRLPGFVRQQLQKQ